MTIESVAALRAQLYQGGFRPIPILNWDAKVPSPGKQPLARDWRQDALKDPPFCLTVPPVAHALNSGILCDGLRAIDLDIDDPALAARCRAIAVDRFGEAPIRMRRNSARCLILYRAASGTPPKIAITGATHSKVAGCKIEVLGAGQQFVAFGRHDSGADLEWFPEAPGEATLLSLPAITEQDVISYLEAVAPLLGAEPPTVKANGHDHQPHSAGDVQAEPLRVAAAVASIPNAGAPDWEWWNKIGMAIYAATGGSAIGGELFNEWSKRHPSYDETETEERWKHYRRSPPTSIGAGTLFHLAGSAFRSQPEMDEPPEWFDDAPTWDSINSEAEEATIPAADEGRPAQPFPATAVSEAKLTKIPPRELVYGHFLFRKFVSALGAPGGSGKTAYAYAVALAILTGRDILSEGVYDPGNIWIYNLEDPETELYRRLKAAMIGHDLSFSDIDGKLFMDSGRDRPLVIAKAQRDGTVIAWPQVPDLIAEIKARDIHLLVVDPFVRSHRVEENHNDQIDFVAALWASIADAADCAILLVHHFKKGGVSGDAGAFRGASALIDASRAAVTLSTMAPDEAQRLAIPEKDRWQFVRVDNAKLNLAPPPDAALWLRLTGVSLDNATDERKADNVQTVKRWEAPSAFEGMSVPAVIRVLERLHHGPGGGDQFSLTGGTKGRWAGLVIMAETGKNEAEAKRIIAIWKKSGLIQATNYISPTDRKQRSGMEVDEVMFAELRQQGSVDFPE